MLNFITFPNWIRPEIIPGLPFRWYALMYIIAFGITYLLFRYQQKKLNLNYDKDTVLNLFVAGIVGLIVGARLFSVIVYGTQGQLMDNPFMAFLPFSCEGGKFNFTGFQGMSFHGGVIGCVIGIIIYGKVKKLDILEWGDLIVAGIPLGYMFGRFGNFINGELYGRVTTLPWGMIFPHAEKLSTDEKWAADAAQKINIPYSPGDMINLPRHPSQLYEGFFEGVFLWFVIWFIFRKRKPFKGFIIGIYIIGYGLVRFIIEYFREPDNGKFLILFDPGHSSPYQCDSLLNFTMGQLLCFLMIIGGALALYIFSRIAKNKAIPVDEEKPSLKKLRKKIK